MSGAEFALASSIIGTIGFTLSLWGKASEIAKDGSSITIADCAREASSLQAHCDRVRQLQDAETELAEAVRIKAIAAETRKVAEELAGRLAKCQLPPDKKGWKRYRDVMSVLWNDMRMDPSSQIARLEALRNELQSDILVSMSRKVNLSDLKNTQGFQKLDSDVKILTESVLRSNGLLNESIDTINATVAKNQKEILAALRKRDPGVAGPAETDEDALEADRNARIKELKKRLWFDAIPQRHGAITAAHKKTFEWIFSGQRKTAESNTTLMEWMSEGSGLYWISGRAGTGKSSLMRFLDDDTRTKEAFQGWAAGKPLVLASFYFWNSEAATDPLLKSLHGLFRGILYSLIKQDDSFAEILFPDHMVEGMDWGEMFPSLHDMSRAFERISTADTLPVAVGLIIDGLDEYEAENSQQMDMARTLCKAAISPNLKIIVSSRPETAFETVFRDSRKLRLPELTDEDRRTYVTDKLAKASRLATFATKEQELDLINLVVERSEGIFLWVHLAVETLLQEIDVAIDVDKLKEVVEDMPSGRKELAQVFDHMLRKRIPAPSRILGFRLIRTLSYAYTLRDKFIPWVEGRARGHLMTAVLCSFFDDSIASTLEIPTRPLDRDKAALRIAASVNLVRRASAGLLELRQPNVIGEEVAYLADRSATAGLVGSRHPDETAAVGKPLVNPELHFLHKDVSLYLANPDITQFLDEALESVKTTLHSNLLKCVVVMTKIYNADPSKNHKLFIMDIWDIWRYVEFAMRIARISEDEDNKNTERLLDELDHTMTKLVNLLPSSPWEEYDGAFLKNNERRLHWTDYFPVDPHHYGGEDPKRGQCSNFLSFTIEQGLFRYVEAKLKKTGKQAITKPGRPLLSSACGVEPIWRLLRHSIRPETVNILLDYGANPNEEFQGKTSWMMALDVARRSGPTDGITTMNLAKVLRLLLSAGANPYNSIHWTTSEGRRRARRTIHHSLTAELVIVEYFASYSGETVDGAREWDGPPLFLTEPERKQIVQVGQSLVSLIRKKKTWRASLSHRAKLLKGRLNGHLSKSTKIPRRLGRQLNLARGKNVAGEEG